MRPILLHLVVFMTLCTSSTFANTLQQPNSNTNGGGVAPLLKDVFAFWVKHGVDQQYGKHNAVAFMVQIMSMFTVRR